MRVRTTGLIALAGHFTLVAGQIAASPRVPSAPAVPGLHYRQLAKAAVENGLRFLQADGAKWKKERQCSTCHHGVMTVIAFAEAKSQGYFVEPEEFRETLKWTKDRLLALIDKPRDTRPGFSMVNSAALYLALVAQFTRGQDALSENEIQQIRGHLVLHQEDDGAWSWASAPPKNRPPPVFESDEVATLLACIALGNEKPESRDKASLWLSKNSQNDPTQSDVLRLLLRLRDGKSSRQVRADVDRMLRKQNKDGGWGQLPGRESDAYATGQALYALSLAGFKPNRREIKRAVEFLVSSQNADGSWPITPRSHEGATPAANPAPIIYSGSAWGTIGLARSVPQ